MDDKRKKEIDAAWSKARRKQFFAEVISRPGRLALLGVVIALIAFFFIVRSVPPSLIETLQGRVVGEFATPSKNFPPRWSVTVQLDSGETVNISMPRSEILRQDRPMKVAHMRKVIGPLTQHTYVFAGYAEPAK